MRSEIHDECKLNVDASSTLLELANQCVTYVEQNEHVSNELTQTFIQRLKHFPSELYLNSGGIDANVWYLISDTADPIFIDRVLVAISCDDDKHFVKAIQYFSKHRGNVSVFEYSCLAKNIDVPLAFWRYRVLNTAYRDFNINEYTRAHHWPGFVLSVCHDSEKNSQLKSKLHQILQAISICFLRDYTMNLAKYSSTYILQMYYFVTCKAGGYIQDIIPHKKQGLLNNKKLLMAALPDNIFDVVCDLDPKLQMLMLWQHKVLFQCFRCYDTVSASVAHFFIDLYQSDTMNEDELKSLVGLLCQYMKIHCEVTIDKAARKKSRKKPNKKTPLAQSPRSHLVNSVYHLIAANDAAREFLCAKKSILPKGRLWKQVFKSIDSVDLISSIKNKPSKAKKKKLRKIRRKHSVITIQKLAKSFLFRKKLLRRYQSRRRIAVLIMQKNIRGWMQRRSPLGRAISKMIMQFRHANQSKHDAQQNRLRVQKHYHINFQRMSTLRRENELLTARITDLNKVIHEADKLSQMQRDQFDRVQQLLGQVLHANQNFVYALSQSSYENKLLYSLLAMSRGSCAAGAGAGAGAGSLVHRQLGLFALQTRPRYYRYFKPLPILKHSVNTAEIVCCRIHVTLDKVLVQVCSGVLFRGEFVFSGLCRPFRASIKGELTWPCGYYDLAMDIPFQRDSSTLRDIEQIRVFDPFLRQHQFCISALEPIHMSKAVITCAGERIAHQVSCSPSM